MNNQKTYNPDNFLVKSSTMTGEQYEVLRKWLGDNYKPHLHTSYSYNSIYDAWVRDKDAWMYRGTSGGRTVYTDHPDGSSSISAWCHLNSNKPPVITFEEFEKYILNNDKESNTMTTEDNKEIHTDLPDYDFKISCGDRPEVRQWLKENGVSWKDGTDILDGVEGFPYLIIRDGDVQWREAGGYYGEFKDLPELTLEFTVSGYTTEHDQEKEELKTQIKKLEEKLAEMREKL